MPVHIREVELRTGIRMFCLASSFNHPLASSDVGNVLTFENMFSPAHMLNQSLPWDVSSAQNMDRMFEDARSFNQQSLQDWDMKDVSTMKCMFSNAVRPFRKTFVPGEMYSSGPLMLLTPFKAQIVLARQIPT